MNPKYHLLLLTLMVTHLSLILFAREPSITDLEAVDYISLPCDDWKVLTPEEQGIDWNSWPPNNTFGV